MATVTTLCFLALLVMSAEAGCRRANWWGSFDKKGVSRCGSSSEYINGFFRNDAKGSKDYVHLLEEAECCSRPNPWRGSSTLVEFADWWGSFDRNNNWNMCPNGYFLQGLYRTDSSKGRLHNIEEGKCARPADHPPYYGHCYTQNVWSCFDKKGLCKCNSGYFITGLYRGGCNNLYCLEEFKCCKMRSSKETLDEKYKVKSRIMDITLKDMAYLAHNLGYGWCAGCRAQYVGEDFRRDGDTWRADKSGRCSGYKNDHRLNIKYGDWAFALKDIKFGNPVITDLTPETVDSGPVYNRDSTPLTQTITRNERIIKTVTHTTTSSWKQSHELGIEINYTPPSATGGVGGSVSYKFGYESGGTTTDSKGNTQNKSFTVTSAKTLAPNSAAKWKVVISKTRTTIAYTATVIATFSAELQGFLRWGGGYNGASTNYHYQHRGSGGRPTFNYKFGDAKTPFYTALKRQSDTNSRPWMWSDMFNRHPSARSPVRSLMNERRYEFKLTGRFEDVSGKHVEIQWDTIPLGGRRKRASDEAPKNPTIVSNGSHIAKVTPNDAPGPQPEPPKVDLDVDLANDILVEEKALGD